MDRDGAEERSRVASDALVASLGSVFESFPSIRFALLFGSAAAGRLRADSDLDVAVYGESSGMLDVESDRQLDGETALQVALERVTDRNVDLLVLNRAPATVCAAAVLHGIPVLMRDAGLYRRFCLAVTDAASAFLETEREFREIRGRSTSLAAIDRSRLERILDFIDEEMSDRPRFAAVGPGEYRALRDTRRNMDRWVESLVNAAIDIAKIVVASLHRPVPQTYGQALSDLEGVAEFARLAGRLGPLASLRNILAHEYLDLRFARLARFASSESLTIAELAREARTWLAGQPPA